MVYVWSMAHDSIMCNSPASTDWEFRQSCHILHAIKYAHVFVHGFVVHTLSDFCEKKAQQFGTIQNVTVDILYQFIYKSVFEYFT